MCDCVPSKHRNILDNYLGKGHTRTPERNRLPRTASKKCSHLQSHQHSLLSRKCIDTRCMLIENRFPSNQLSVMVQPGNRPTSQSSQTDHHLQDHIFVCAVVPRHHAGDPGPLKFWILCHRHFNVDQINERISLSPIQPNYRCRADRKLEASLSHISYYNVIVFLKTCGLQPPERVLILGRASLGLPLSCYICWSLAMTTG